MWWTLLACDGAKDVVTVVDETTLHSESPTTEVVACPDGLPGPTLETTTGCVVGREANGRQVFHAIPYAEPPIGPRRFAPPEPVAPWDAPLDRADVGAKCVQFSDSLTGDLGVGDGQEDCLTLEVMRPAGADGLPVLFFVHGGGHLAGSGTESIYADDPLLAEAAVVVTVNYRLGPLGFLAHPALSAEDPDNVSGNFGMRDVATALQWVNDNAAALGGDPDHIVVFGESAGALETCAMVLSPRTAGLFDAAIAQSGPCQSVGRPLRGAPLLQLDGETQGEAFATDLGCADPACLREAPLDDVVQFGQADVAAGPGATGYQWGPWLDAVWLPLDPVGAMKRGDWNRVPFLATVNQDEGTVFTVGLAPTQAALDGWIDLYGTLLRIDRAELAATYDAGLFGSTDAAFAAMWGDAVFVCPTVWQQRALAAQGDAWGVYWTEEIPVLGAFHGSELPTVFGTGLLVGRAGSASERVRAAWTSMANGDPRISDLPGAWPQADEAWVELSFDTSAAIAPPGAGRCDVFLGSLLDVW